MGLMDYKARFYSPGLKRFISPDSIIPDLTNPQSLNRYSYAYNSPVVYRDPTGHLPEQGNTGEDCLDGWMCFDNPVEDYSTDPDTYLQLYAGHKVVELGGVNDLEAMADIIDKADEIYGDDRNGFLNGLTKVFNGVSYSGVETVWDAAYYNACRGIGRGPDDGCGNVHYFSDTGFHKVFSDEKNQLFHVWAYIATSATGDHGFSVSEAANFFHERLQSDSGASWQDYYLGLAGMEIGYKLYTGDIKQSQLGKAVREMLSTNPWDYSIPDKDVTWP